MQSINHLAFHLIFNSNYI